MFGYFIHYIKSLFEHQKVALDINALHVTNAPATCCAQPYFFFQYKLQSTTPIKNLFNNLSTF